MNLYQNRKYNEGRIFHMFKDRFYTTSLDWRDSTSAAVIPMKKSQQNCNSTVICKHTNKNQGFWHKLLKHILVKNTADPCKQFSAFY